MASTLSDLRRQADEQAQRALRAMNDYQAKHGRRNLLLEQRYEAAERVLDAVDEYDRLDDLAYMEASEDWSNLDALHDAAWAESIVTGRYVVDAPKALTPDAGDHYAWPV